MNTYIHARYQVSRLPKAYIFWIKDETGTFPDTTRRSMFEQAVNSPPEDVLVFMQDQYDTTNKISAAIGKREVLRLLEVRERELIQLEYGDGK